MKQILLTTLFLLVLQYGNAQVVDQDVPRNARDQVISDDLIVLGSECVGLDCSNGESFGFSTIILKENNVRLKFFDTSNSASFPTNDWTIEANETSNGGRSYLGIRDDNTGRLPFSVAAGAPNNSLFVSSAGRLGIRTGSPVTDIHVVNGNTPTLRLEQDGTQGFTPQTWDLAGNETNFFVRDVTGGSKLPFRIRPQAPTNSIFVKADGNVGLGTASPDAALHVTGAEMILGSGAAANTTKLLVGKGRNAVGNAQIDLFTKANPLPGDFQMRLSAEGASSNFSHNAAGPFRIKTIDPASSLGFFTTNLERMVIEAGGTVRINGSATVNGGVAVTSDRRLKMNVRPLERGLKELLQLEPVMYEYTGAGSTSAGREYAGVIAQELQEVVPEFVSDHKIEERDDDGKVISEQTYLKVHDTELKYIMVNAIKEQQTLIEEQKEVVDAQNEKITELEADLSELRNIVQNIQNNLGQTTLDSEVGYLGQNTPNPAKGETEITYVVPKNSSRNAIHVYSIEGKLIKEINIPATGKGKVNMKVHDLPAGVYSYQLVVDGKQLETKQMILQ